MAQMTRCPIPFASCKQLASKQECYRRHRLAPFVQLRVWQCDSHLSLASSTWRYSKRLTPFIARLPQTGSVQASYGAQWFRTTVNRHELLSTGLRHAASAANCFRPPIVDGSGRRGRRPDRLPRRVRAGGGLRWRLSGNRRRAVAARTGQTSQRLRSLSPGSRIVIWAETLTTDLLLATIECHLDGLLSSALPAEEASCALARICRGERILRFDSDRNPFPEPDPAHQVASAAAFDAQWMLHGAEPQGREK